MKIYFIILAFFILRMILAQKKKGQQAQTEATRLKKAEERLRAQRASAPAPRLAAQREARPMTTITRTTSDDAVASAAYADNSGYGEGYATQEDTNTESGYGAANRSEDELTASEHDAVSHFLKNTGLSDLDRKVEAKEEQEAYSKVAVKKAFVTKENFRQFIIAKEIFDKPKAMKR